MTWFYNTTSFNRKLEYGYTHGFTHSPMRSNEFDLKCYNFMPIDLKIMTPIRAIH